MRVVESSDDGRERRKAESVLLRLHGSSNQRERWSADLLPEDELLMLARNTLFSPFTSFPRWRKLQVTDFRHDKSCRGGVVTFDTRAPTELTAEEWTAYRKLHDALHGESRMFETYGATFSIELVEHVGSCTACSAETFGRSASIRIEWASRPLSREYTLENV